jgi:deazaflavin-dependent oxidoreductase (nitroreductase family)
VRTAALVLVLATTLVAHAGDEPPLTEIDAALQRIASHSTIEITTLGRKTGKEHAKPIWFVVSDGKIIVQAGKDGQTDWYRNLMAKPAAMLREGDYTFRARSAAVTDPARVEAIHKLFLGKYTSAWLLSFVGSSIGRGKPVELTPVSVDVAR